MEIPIKEIFIPPDRQRREVKESAVAELAVSIQARGQLHPVVVTELDRVRFPDAPAHLQYQLVAGYRRLLANALLKRQEIKAELLSNFTRLEQEEIELDENLMREQLSWQNKVKAKAGLVVQRKKLYEDSFRSTSRALA